MTHHQLAFNLLHRFESNTDNDHQRGTADTEVHLCKLTEDTRGQGETPRNKAPIKVILLTTFLM